ncbi:MAG: hypothetical protein IJ055_07900 [Oscillospiraceae bacterium]|nr:hypothetical protein [Oscillospiraceae bacterium]
MRSQKRVLVIGGDLRYGYTARALSRHFDTYALGFTRRVLPFPEVAVLESAAQGVPVCDALVLPMPVSDDGVCVNAPLSPQVLPLHSLVPLVREGGTVFGGRFGKAQEVFDKAGIRTVDYLQEEALSVANAVPTAEGALQILLEEMPRTLCGSRVLVLGYGRIGSRLAHSLHALGARVTVAARRLSDRTHAEAVGCRAVPTAGLAGEVGGFDVICNTVPAVLLTREVLSAVSPDALVLDLASKPGGVDWEAAKALSVRVVWALSLPGRTAPVTAGEIIARTVTDILTEGGNADGA